MACTWCKSNDHLGIECPQRNATPRTESPPHPDSRAVAQAILDQLFSEFDGEFSIRLEDDTDHKVEIKSHCLVAAGYRFRLEYGPDD